MTDQKRISILGATGSVGLSTVDLIRRDPDKYKIISLTANKNVELLAQLAKEFLPEFVAIGDSSLLPELSNLLQGYAIQVAGGTESLVEAASLDCDWVMSAIVGAAGLEPTLASIRKGVNVAFANKETLVCGGELVMQEVEKHNARLLPVDSEHNAIFQVFETSQKKQIRKLHLTGSGGPFRTWSRENMLDVTPAQAVNHPNWSMGAKISVDSATMMNKGLELIEACYLFDLPENKIDILVHPQSVVHSMVEYEDG
ncbi:MAG: 1-deoxy-D-xylulose-5-phosphate reductoisomerase, partial [Alphaproteobacteria bacterium]|nr:1-deoxy-D-xylulose-5-phosphate reductoisomerase [Alphaproteobacteria bacterium]